MIPLIQMHSRTIDPALRERRAVLELLHRVDRPELTYAQLEGIAEELAGAGQQAGAVLAQEIAKTEDLERLNRLTFLAAYLDDERLVDTLARLLYHPHRSRTYKAHILQALERLGVDTDHRAYRNLFSRTEVIRLNLAELFRRMESQSEAAVQFLYDLFYAGDEQRLTTARLLLDDGSPAALDLAVQLAEVADPGTAAFVVQGLGRLRQVHSLRALEDLRRYSVSPVLRDEAARAMRRLGFAGVRPEPVPARELPPLKSWASRVEGNGTQLVWLALPTAEDRADTVCFLLHEGRGLIDCFGEVDTRLSQFEEHQVQVREPGMGAPVALAYARELLEQALEQGREQGLPVPPEFPFRVRRLGLADLHPHAPAAEAEVRHDGPLSAERWETLIDLFGEPVLEDWMVEDPEFFQQAGELAPVERMRRMELDRFTRRAFLDYVAPELPQMRRRLMRNAAWARAIGADPALALRLEQAAATLAHPNPDENPFVRRFVHKSLADVQEMIRDGYDPSWLLDDIDS